MNKQEHDFKIIYHGGRDGHYIYWCKKTGAWYEKWFTYTGERTEDGYPVVTQERDSEITYPEGFDTDEV